MPVYANVLPPVSISQGDSATVIKNEDPSTGLSYKSSQAALVSGLRINA